MNINIYQTNRDTNKLCDCDVFKSIQIMCSKRLK